MVIINSIKQDPIPFLLENEDEQIKERETAFLPLGIFSLCKRLSRATYP